MTKQVEKKWLKRKGCKNCALVWHELPHYEDCDSECGGHGVWRVEPYHKGKEFVYVSKGYEVEDFEQTHLKNVYFNKEGQLVIIRKYALQKEQR